MTPRFQQILGVRFIDGSPAEAIEYLEREGGYVVVPAAPALVNITRDPGYRRALIEADMAIADSGFMVLLWLVLRRQRISRISGLRYLQELFQSRVTPGKDLPFFVMPSEEAFTITSRWLNARNITLGRDNTYIAPLYGLQVQDRELVEILNQRRPNSIIIAIGGGAQEKLGLYLRQHLSYRPVIHCIGAALGFITGHQKPIPKWADRLYLGWLLRTLRQPRVFGPRFWSARSLPRLIWKYGETLPLLETEAQSETSNN